MKELRQNHHPVEIVLKNAIPGRYLSQALSFEEKFGSVFLRFNYGCFFQIWLCICIPSDFCETLVKYERCGPISSGATVGVLKQTEWGKFWIVWDDIGFERFWFPSIFRFTPSRKWSTLTNIFFKWVGSTTALCFSSLQRRVGENFPNQRLYLDDKSWK